MTIITATELKENLGKYLILAQTEDIEITKNGKSVVRLVSTAPREAAKPIKSISELFGAIHGDVNLDEARWERLKNKCGL